MARGSDAVLGGYGSHWRKPRLALGLLLGTVEPPTGELEQWAWMRNLDLPWNPSRLEQRKGRIQRIGQPRDTVDIYNLRYAGSVEDRVHALLSERLENIATLFGQIPDILEDLWIDLALGELEAARKIIDAVPKQHPLARARAGRPRSQDRSRPDDDRGPRLASLS